MTSLDEIKTFMEETIKEAEWKKAFRERYDLPNPERVKFNRTNGYIYFIQSNDEIKIGWSTNPEWRLKTLQTGSFEPLILLGYVPGTLKDEAKLHKFLKSIKIKSEWFQNTDELYQLIKEILHENTLYGIVN